MSKIKTSLPQPLNMLTTVKRNLQKENPHGFFYGRNKKKRKVAFTFKRDKGKDAVENGTKNEGFQ